MSRCATEAKISLAISGRASSRTSIPRHGLVVAYLAQALGRDPLRHPPGRGWHQQVARPTLVVRLADALPLTGSDTRVESPTDTVSGAAWDFVRSRVEA